VAFPTSACIEAFKQFDHHVCCKGICGVTAGGVGIACKGGPGRGCVVSIVVCEVGIGDGDVRGAGGSGGDDAACEAGASGDDVAGEVGSGGDDAAGEAG
jgi:hypothetical protein